MEIRQCILKQKNIGEMLILSVRAVFMMKQNDSRKYVRIRQQIQLHLFPTEITKRPKS